MSILRTDSDGLRQAAERLDAGEPIVVPLRPPRAYVVAGCDAAAVNTAKGRPPGQPVGVAVIDLLGVRPYLDLDDDAVRFADWLTRHELLNLFVPVLEPLPDWLRPSVSEGWAGITTVPPQGVGALWGGRGHLYVSSANATGGEVASTAESADAAFDGTLLVLDDGTAHDPRAATGSAAIVRVRQSGIAMVRPGINDALFAGDREQFLADLGGRWAARQNANARNAPFRRETRPTQRRARRGDRR